MLLQMPITFQILSSSLTNIHENCHIWLSVRIQLFKAIFQNNVYSSIQWLQGNRRFMHCSSYYGMIFLKLQGRAVAVNHRYFQHSPWYRQLLSVPSRGHEWGQNEMPWLFPRSQTGKEVPGKGRGTRASWLCFSLGLTCPDKKPEDWRMKCLW